MNIQENTKAIKILLVEDNPGDARLVQETLRESKLLIDLFHVIDGVEALDFLMKKEKYINTFVPDLILLDLNLPKKNGHDVLQEIKENDNFKQIPVIVMTVSQSEEDIMKSYKNHANCFISKPLDFNQFIKVVQTIEDFWFTIVKLPER